jgi:hypothetical protein
MAQNSVDRTLGLVVSLEEREGRNAALTPGGGCPQEKTNAQASTESTGQVIRCGCISPSQIGSDPMVRRLHHPGFPRCFRNKKSYPFKVKMSESIISLKTNIVNSKDGRRSEKRSAPFHDVSETKRVTRLR